MKLIAEKKEYVVVEKEDKWVLYNTVTQIVMDNIWKSDNDQYPFAIIDKWGFEPVDPPIEIDSLQSLIPAHEALFMTEEEVMEERKKGQEKFFKMHMDGMTAEQKKELKKQMEEMKDKDEEE